MGYSTKFDGTIKIDKQLTEDQKNYINRLADTRRMARTLTPEQANDPKALHNIVGLGIGDEGEYYVCDKHDDNINNGNRPPRNQPSLWCQWIINDDNEIEWDGGEKFYSYIEWMEYILHILSDWGYVCNGEISWHGEHIGDTGTIHVINNVVEY